MAKTQELYILNDGGQVLYYHTTESEEQQAERPNMLLTASYLTAVLQFAKAASGAIISSFELGKSRIVIRLGKNIPVFYVLRADKGTRMNEKKIAKQLTKIMDEFEKIFKEENIKNWNGDVEAFKELDTIVKKVFK